MNLTTKSLSGKIIKAISLFTGVQAIGIICSIVRTKLIALWIGTTGVGLFATFNSVIELMTAATQLNLRQSAVREISDSSTSRLPHTTGAVRWWAKHLGIIGAILMTLLSPLLSYISFGDTTYWWGFILLSVALFALSISNGEQAIMQGTSSLKLLAKSTMWGSITGTALSIPLYYLLGIKSIVPSIIIFAIATMAFSYVLNPHRSHHNSRKDNIRLGKNFMKLGAYLTLPAVTATAASYIFISYLNQTAGTDATGIYQAGYTLLIRYTGIIFTALSMEYFPRITRICTRPRMTSTLASHEMLIILYILTPLLVIFVSSDRLLIYLLYSEKFMQALPFVSIGALAMVFRAVSYCMAYVIIARGDGKTYVITELVSDAIGLTLNIIMYRHYSYTGLGLSYVIWYALYTFIVWIPYKKYGMKISTPAIKATTAAIIIVGLSIILKAAGWWWSLTMTLPAIMLSAYGYKNIRKQKS